MRADRLLSILLLLQVHRRITARELALRLEVSERTIHRDMLALSSSGVPVVAERGSCGGWSLLEEYRTNLTGLNEAEIQALFLSGPPRLLRDLGLQQASEAALIKLLAVLPAVHRRDAEYVRQRIHIDSSGWYNNTREEVPTLPILQEAIWQERKLSFTYQHPQGDAPVERIVNPLGLVAKGSVWYFVSMVESQVRVYRVSRIQRATILEQSCQRPPEFDLATCWNESSRTFKAMLPRFYVQVRVRENLLPRVFAMSKLIRIEHVSEPMCDGDGWRNVTLQFECREEAAGFLLNLGTGVEILEPQDLHVEILQLAEAVVAKYSLRLLPQY